MTDAMDVYRRRTFDETDLCETSSAEIRDAVKCALWKEPAEDDRRVLVESGGALDAVGVDGGCPVTGGRGDISEVYEILPTILGTGHHGCVRECLRRATGERLAVKTIDKGKASRLDDIRRDIESLRSVDRPGIARVADCYEDDEYVHIVTERHAGGELHARIERQMHAQQNWIQPLHDPRRARGKVRSIARSAGRGRRRPHLAVRLPTFGQLRRL